MYFATQFKNTIFLKPSVSALMFIFVFLDFYTLNSFASNVRCEEIILGAKHKDIDQIMNLFFKNKRDRPKNGNTYNDFFDMIWNSKQLEQYVLIQKIQRPANPTESDKYKIISGYLESSLNQISKPEVYEPMQNDTMRRSFKLRGIIPQPNENYRQTMKRISKLNVFRIAKSLQDFVPYDAKIETVIKNLEVYLAHNSHIMREPPSLAIVSPKTIDSLGLTNFGMSTYVFNRHIQSDEFVFFSVNVKRRSDSGLVGRSEYGKYGVVLNRESARRDVIISPFVMYISQLHDNVQDLAPDVAGKLKQENLVSRADDQDAWLVSSTTVNSPELIHQLLFEIGKKDLIFDDAEMVVKLFLSYSLHELKRSEPNLFEEIMQTLQTGSAEKITEVVQKYGMKPAGFRGMEGRVPVVVQPSNLIHFSHPF